MKYDFKELKIKELNFIEKELRIAKARFPNKINSLHEGYAILLEEVEELWDEIKKKESTRDAKKITLELLQVATVAIRVYQDLMKESDHE